MQKCTSLQNFILVEKSKQFSTSVVLSGFFVIHDTLGSCQDEVTELTRWQQVSNPFFHILDLDVVSWADDTTFVDSSSQFNNDFVISVIIDDFKFANVSVFLHDSQKFDNDFGRRSQQDLSFSRFFSISNSVQSVMKHRCSNHSAK